MIPFTNYLVHVNITHNGTSSFDSRLQRDAASIYSRSIFLGWRSIHAREVRSGSDRERVDRDRTIRERAGREKRSEEGWAEVANEIIRCYGTRTHVNKRVRLATEKLLALYPLDRSIRLRFPVSSCLSLFLALLIFVLPDAARVRASSTRTHGRIYFFSFLSLVSPLVLRLFEDFVWFRDSSLFVRLHWHVGGREARITRREHGEIDEHDDEDDGWDDEVFRGLQRWCPKRFC